MANRKKEIGPYLDEQANRALRSARAKAGLTQKEVASLLELGETSYVQRENGRQAFTLPEVQKLKELLRLSSIDILEIFFQMDMSRVRAAENRTYFAQHDGNRREIFPRF